MQFVKETGKMKNLRHFLHVKCRLSLSLTKNERELWCKINVKESVNVGNTQTIYNFAKTILYEREKKNLLIFAHLLTKKTRKNKKWTCIWFSINIYEFFIYFFHPNQKNYISNFKQIKEKWNVKCLIKQIWRSFYYYLKRSNIIFQLKNHIEWIN